MEPTRIPKPDWLKTKIPSGKVYFKIKNDLRDRSLFTVCEEAKCPNISECWNTNTATFMVMGDTCTRGCRFCNVKTGNPNGWLDVNEPMQVADTIKQMKLKYVVITMVDRDDLPDGGASHVAQVMTQAKEISPQLVVEILAGDFRNQDDAIKLMLEARPEVYAHNLETVERLTPRVRDHRASYRQSITVLSKIKKLAEYPVLTKSALMLGLGETREDIEKCLQDMREADIDFVTIGQYMRPTKKHLSIKRFVPPEEFAEIGEFATNIGFKGVASAPLVRSSYRAREFYEKAMGISL